MTVPVRLGAVDYLNVRPLVHGLDRHPDLVHVRYDTPAECARLLAAGDIDLGMVPSITHLQRPDDRVVPGICIGSDGPVASVALFLKTPIAQVRTIAVDTSSRTSVALTRILCARRFGIDPVLVPHAPDLAAMLAQADGALVIGDPALFADLAAMGPGRIEKIDLGRVWSEMTGLPFVWAVWAGRAGAASPRIVSLLQEAAESGMADTDAIADRHLPDPAQRAIGRRYLREHLTFRLTDRALEGLRTYYREALALGVATGEPRLEFFDTAGAVVHDERSIGA
jgi:chorismate dehydratase